MQRAKITNESQFLTALSSGICCVARGGERHVVNSAGVGKGEFGEIIFLVETLAENFVFEDRITLFLLDTAREAQQFLIFEQCEFDEDKILNSEVIGEEK